MAHILHHRKGKQNGNDLEANTNGGQSGDAGQGGQLGGSTSRAPTNMNEYAALERYISIYREDRRASIISMKEDANQKGPKRKWWQFWKLMSTKHIQPAQSGPAMMPDSWMETDIHTGIQSSAVEERRKMFGWNELTAEKENLALKFLGYFQGPILYGESVPFPSYMLSGFINTVSSHGNRRFASCRLG